MDKASMQALLAIVDRPVAFHPAIARLAGGVSAGLMLCQLVYWSGKSTIDIKNDSWVKKDWREFEQETALTQDEQRGARRLLLSLGLIQTERRGLDPVLWYRVDFVRLFDLLSAMGNSHCDEGISRSPAGKRDLAKSKKTIGCTQSTSKTTSTTVAGVAENELLAALAADGCRKGKPDALAWAESALRRIRSEGQLSASERVALERHRAANEAPQLVAASPPPLDPETTAKGDAIWAAIAAGRQRKSDANGAT